MKRSPITGGIRVSCAVCVLMTLSLAGCVSTSSAGIERDPVNTNLISITLTDVEMADVILMFTKIAGANIVACPYHVQGRVTVNLNEVEWKAGLETILATHNLELVERVPGSNVYTIQSAAVPRNMVTLLFRPTGMVSDPGRVSLKLHSSSLGMVFKSIAEQAKINIMYESSLRYGSSVTLEAEDVNHEEILTQLAKMHELEFKVSSGTDYYIITRPQARQYCNCPHTYGYCDEDDGDCGAFFAVVAGIIAVVLILTRLRGVVRCDFAAAPKTGKARATVGLFWYAVLTLCVVYSYTLAAHVVWETETPTGAEPRTGVVVLVGLWLACGSFIACTVAIAAGRKRGWAATPRRKRTVWCVACLPLVVLLVDAPPVWRDHSWDDFPVPAVSGEESHECFARLAGTNVVSAGDWPLHMGIEEVLTNATAYAVQITNAWRMIEKERLLIEQLDGYDGIAEFPEEPKIDFKWATGSWRSVRRAGQAYPVYAALMVEQGRAAQGIAELATFYSVVRKALPYTRTVVRKMMLVSIAQQCMRAAKVIAARPDCEPETLALLALEFTPLTHEEVSLRWPLTANYLALKELYGDVMTNAQFFDAFRLYGGWESVNGEWVGPKPAGFWMRGLSRVVAFISFRRNRTVRDLKKLCDRVIEDSDKQPPPVSMGGKALDNYAARPKLNNLGGWLLVVVSQPSFEHAHWTAAKTKIVSDLLAMSLQQRLGKELVLPDYLTGRPLILDEERGVWMSVGPDRQIGTEDDISLVTFR